MLMENFPRGDFEMNFYNGPKIHISTNRREFTIKNSSQSTKPEVFFFDPSKPDSINLDPSQVPIFRHAQECLKQCLEVEMSSLEDPNTRFPLIIKSSRCQNGEYNRAASPNPSLHPSALSSYSASAVSVSGKSKDGEKKSSRVSSESGYALSKCGGAQRSNASAISGCDKEPSTYHIPGTGWLLKFSERRFLMLFDDGLMVKIDAKDQTLHLIDSRLKTQERYIFYSKLKIYN
jgi:hypothetical protein